MGHNKQERKRKEKEIEKKKNKKKKEGFEVTISVEIITFKKLSVFSRLLGLFFLLKYSFRQAMLQLEFGESKSEKSQSEQFITETRKAASCSLETLRSNAGSGPAAAGCPVSNPDNLWKSPLLPRNLTGMLSLFEARKFSKFFFFFKAKAGCISKVSRDKEREREREREREKW